MKKSVIVALLLSATMAQATEISQVYSASVTSTVDSILAIPLMTTGGVVATSASISGQTLKLVVEAKEDAATMVASDGAIRGVALQKALEAIRAENPKLQASDLEIAEGILKM
ncbi:DUF2388 domain-containing protein [Bdellovibrio bacteriovorus]|uniref:DUF2388 domain-containing protein n=1 Tax=Bdellovibrio bacteriovorus TaxID=959 RepID=UPI0035A6B2A0